LRVYLDNRFLEIHTAIGELSEKDKQHTEAVSIAMASANEERTYPRGGFLRFEVRDSSDKVIRTFTVEYHIRSSIQHILDECYFKLDRLVGPYKYLSQWIISEKGTGINFLSDRVNSGTDYRAASTYFAITKEYVIHLLDEPYRINED
jgi:hypothetical protein